MKPFSERCLLLSIEEQRFLSPGNKHVCADCFSDYAIIGFIRNEGDLGQCDYCNRITVVAHIEDVFNFILDGIESEWGHPENSVGWSSEEGGWMGAKVLDSHELIDELELEFHQSSLRNDFVRAIMDQQWCKDDPYAGEEYEEVISQWEYFSQQVKYKSRYVFYRMENANYLNEFVEPYEVLDYIGRAIQKLGLVKELATEPIFRARLHKDNENYTQAEELGPPPIERCIYSNRMSPAGIPMFYGAFNAKTAFDETVSLKDDLQTRATIGQFKLVKPIKVVNLTQLPAVPSLFDEEQRTWRQSIFFLREFIDDLSKPIIKDGREHIDYVPTQIVTEYIRHIFKLENGTKICGIVYPSSRDTNGKACVLFADQANCENIGPVSNENIILQMEKYRVKKISRCKLQRLVLFKVQMKKRLRRLMSRF